MVENSRWPWHWETPSQTPCREQMRFHQVSTQNEAPWTVSRFRSNGTPSAAAQNAIDGKSRSGEPTDAQCRWASQIKSRDVGSELGLLLPFTRLSVHQGRPSVSQSAQHPGLDGAAQQHPGPLIRARNAEIAETAHYGSLFPSWPAVGLR